VITIKIKVTVKNKTALYAANELKSFIEIMTDGTCDIVESDADITLGLLPAGSVKDTLIDDRYVIDIKDGKGNISGSNERSILLGIYRYLKELGCRFVRPGKNGDVIPKRILTGTEVHIDESAFYPFRVECLEGAITPQLVIDTIKWLPKVGYNAFFMQFLTPYTFFKRIIPEQFSGEGLTREEHKNKCYETSLAMTKEIEEVIKTVGLQFHDVGHGYTFEPFGVHYLDSVLTRDIPEEKRSEIEPYLPLRNGKRRVLNGCINWTNLCLSNKKLVEITAEWFVDFMKSKPEIDFLHIWLGDGANNHCECENCMKQSVSDMYVDMLNVIDERFTAAGIDTKIICIQYVNTRHAPIVSRFNNPDRFILMPAVSHDYTKTYTTEKYPYPLPEKDERNNFVGIGDFRGCMGLFDTWRKIYPDLPVMFFDYHLYTSHLTDPGYMFASRIISEDVKQLKNLGSKGLVNCKTQRSYFPTSLPVYASGALLVDPERDFDEIADEYFEAAYGKESKTIREYLEKISMLFDQKLIKTTTSVENFSDAALTKKRAWRNNPEAAKLFGQIEGVVDTFTSNLEEYISSAEDECKKRSFELLTYHGDICKLYGKALLAGALGKDEECNRLVSELIAYAKENEDHYLPEFDVFLFERAINIVFEQ